MSSTFDSISQRYPAYFVPSGIISLDDQQLPIVYPTSTRVEKNKSIAIVVRDGRMFKHYFHFVEIMFGAYCLCSEYFPGYTIQEIYVGKNQWDINGPNGFQNGLTQVIYPEAAIVQDQGGSACNILVIDRSLYNSNGSIRSTLNKFLEPFGQIGRAWAHSFRERVWSFAGMMEEEGNDKIYAGHATRNPPRAFGLDVSEKLDFLFRERGAETVQLDFTHTPWMQQVTKTALLSCLYGVHGNGLTNLIWMRPGSIVFEFFPPTAHHYDYQLLCEIFSLKYFGFQETNFGGSVWREFSRSGCAYGEEAAVNAPISTVPWYLVEEVVSSLTFRRNAAASELIAAL